MTLSSLLNYLYIIPAALIAVVLHELAHGLVSYLLGDPTPKETGRLTLNPLHHLDWMGLLCLVLFHVGWAKPVMIDSRYYKHPKLGMFLVSFAGPLMNFILAFLFGLFYCLIYCYAPSANTFFTILYYFCFYTMVINVGLGLFNLIPIPPLDGSKMVGCLLPGEAYDQYMKYQRYGMIFMIVVLGVIYFLDYMGYPSILDAGLEAVVNFIVKVWLVVLP